MLGVRENFSEWNRGSRRGAIVTKHADADTVEFLAIVSPKITRKDFSDELRGMEFFAKGI